MKNKIISVIFILIIAFQLFSIENIQSINVSPNEKYQLTNHPYIDKNIILSKKHITILSQAANEIKESKVKEFIQKIIDIIKKQNIVDKGDIEKVINNLNLDTKIKGIHFLCLLNSDGIGYGYARGIYPYIFESIFYKLFFLDAFFGPSIFAEWQSPDANTKINGKSMYNEPHNGYVLGFFGYTWSDGIWPVVYKILGLCTLVIITDYDF